MRISAQAKLEVRTRILRAATELFRRGPIEQLTTRSIADAAGIAHGTLFNYFATREALALALIADALERGRARAKEQRRDGATLAEHLYAQISEELRALARDRELVAWALARGLAPTSHDGGACDELRAAELAAVEELLALHEIGDAAPAHAAHLYWTLHLGVLGYWVADASPAAEDTRALLDETTQFMARLWDAPAARRSDFDAHESR